MSNGKRFDRKNYTCASRTYKLGTVLIVSFPKKGTFVMVTVTDHGPYKHPSRVIDLSEKAATVLGLKPYGLGFVTIKPLHLRLKNPLPSLNPDVSDQRLSRMLTITDSQPIAFSGIS